jgi:hypothetical protein
MKKQEPATAKLFFYFLLARSEKKKKNRKSKIASKVLRVPYTVLVCFYCSSLHHSILFNFLLLWFPVYFSCLAKEKENKKTTTSAASKQSHQLSKREEQVI